MWIKSFHQLIIFVTILLICFLLTQTVESRKCAEKQFRCNNGDCVHGLGKCDGVLDCSDESDEQNCPIRNCTDKEFRCASKKQCISKLWVCDGSTDCLDGSDERNCTVKCGPGQFFCFNSQGQCITHDWKCDGEEDCPNGEDESDETCRKKNDCPENHFLCPDSYKCIPKNWLCDTDFDCPGKQDEMNCGHKACTEGEFSCHNNAENELQECVSNHWRCDGFKDCDNGFDEENCNNTKTCNDNEFQCGDGLCIPKSKKCDGHFDCSLKEDEKDCLPITCPDDEFFCPISNICIPKAYKCNGHPDCFNTSSGKAIDEEGCTTTELNRFKKCEKIGMLDCSPKANGPKPLERQCVDWDDFCSRRETCGVSSEEAKKICDAIDACNENPEKCRGCFTSLPNGKEVCYCPDEYELSTNRKSCQFKNRCNNWGVCSHPKKCQMKNFYPKCGCHKGYYLRNSTCHASTPGSIFFAHPHVVKAFSTNWDHFLNFPKTIVSQANHALALAVDVNKNIMFYSDMNMGSIWKVEMDRNLSPLNKKKIQSEKMKIIEGLAFDWTTDNLYWTDTGRKVIEVMSVDEPENRKELFRLDHTMEPRGIVLDPRNGWMYWTDWGQKKIEKAGMDGTNRRTLLEKQNGILWPNGLAIDYYTDTLFWVDGSMFTINRVSLDGSKRSVILSDSTFLQLPFSLAVFEDFIYWSDWNSHGLFKAHKYADVINNKTVETLVSTSYEINGIKIFHPNQQPYVPENPCRINNGGCSHLCLISPKLTPTAKLTRRCACPGTAKFAFDNKTKCVSREDNGKPISSSSPDNVDRPVKRQINTDNKAVGKVAGIVIACLVLILILSGVAGYFVHRSYRKRYIRSMNFDNPVYRKTTTTEATEDVLLKFPGEGANGNIPNRSNNRPAPINHVQMATEHLMNEVSNHSLA